MKIVFIGTPEFSAIILERICQSNFKPVLVITAPDKPVGRKQIISSPPVKIISEKYNIPVLQPEKITEAKKELEKISPDLIILSAYGKILPKDILNIPKYGCLNIHPSLLPKYRGSSPIQMAILNGDKKTGITIILMVEKMDEGPVLASKEYKIKPNITYKELEKELAELGGKVLVDTIPKWIKKRIKPRSQDNSKAIYTKILTREDGVVDWKKPAEFIERQVRAFNPWPGTFCNYQQSEKTQKMKILEANVLKQTKHGPFGPPGKTFLAPDDKIAVQTGKDFLIITKLQPEGKKAMSSADFLRGHWDFIGIILY
jgi:methionyl-tRNA formyltransferase